MSKIKKDKKIKNIFCFGSGKTFVRNCFSDIHILS